MSIVSDVLHMPLPVTNNAMLTPDRGNGVTGSDPQTCDEIHNCLHGPPG